MKTLMCKLSLAKFSVMFFSAMLFSVSACSSEAQSTKLQGRWAVDCSKSTSLKFGDRKSAILTVNQNQIYIEIKYKETSDDAAEFFYVQPDELGMGGEAIDWDSVSVSEKVGVFKMVGEKKAKFSWLGFLNKKTGKHILVKEADFATSTNEVALVRCD